MKSTMNGTDIAKFRKLLKSRVPIDEISKFLGVEKGTLALFTPEKVAAHAVLKKEHEEQVKSTRQKQQNLTNSAAKAAVKAAQEATEGT